MHVASFVLHAVIRCRTLHVGACRTLRVARCTRPPDRTALQTELGGEGFRRSSAAVAALNGCLYIAGGRNKNGDLALVEMFDIRNQRRLQLAPLTTARRGLGLVALDGALYAVGTWPAHHSMQPTCADARTTLAVQHHVAQLWPRWAATGHGGLPRAMVGCHGRWCPRDALQSPVRTCCMLLLYAHGVCCILYGAVSSDHLTTAPSAACMCTPVALPAAVVLTPTLHSPITLALGLTTR
jgi:hypothetical protein